MIARTDIVTELRETILSCHRELDKSSRRMYASRASRRQTEDKIITDSLVKVLNLCVKLYEVDK